GCRGLLEKGRFLAVGVTAAAVVANLAGTDLMPGLGHIEHEAMPVQRLKRERVIGRNLGEKAGIRVAIRVERLFASLTPHPSPRGRGEKVAHGNLAKDAHPLMGVIEEAPLVLADVRLLQDDADGVNVAVFIEAGVGALIDPAAQVATVSSLLGPRDG